jgi:type I restriction enzyme R subunit
VEHFQSSVSDKLGGKAKAMIVTSSRLHAVRYRLAVDAHLQGIGSPHKALVAFTDTVKDAKDGKEYTEANMNGFPEAATADRFEADEYRFLIVASKFQTGFDQPKLVAMYVDKKLSGVACVQTLSRLNRTTAGKEGTFVLDFENSAEDIEKGFQPFYDRVTLSKETDPNQLYNIRTDLDKFGIHEVAELESFAKLWFADKPKIPMLHAAADPVAKKWKAEEEKDQVDYKSKARDFVKLYAFMSHLVPLRDTGLEKLFMFLRFLLPKLPAKKGELPLEVLGMVNMEKLAVRKNDKKDIGLKRGETKVDPLNYGGGATLTEEEHEALSKIIEDLNSRFSTSFTEDEIMVIKHLEKKISEDEALQQQLKNSARHAVEATFQQVAKDAFEDLVNENFKFYKKVSDDAEVSKEFFARLFDWYVEGHSTPPANEPK